MEERNFEENESTSSFDMQRYVSRLLSNFYWFIIAIALFVTGAFLYIRYTNPLYQVSTYILIQQPNDAMTTLGGSPFVAAGGTGAGAGMTNYLDPSNEMFKLQSNVLVGKVVDSLKLDVTVVKIGRFRNTPVSDEFPFSLKVNKSAIEHESPLYKLSLSPHSFTFQTEEKQTIRGFYNQPVVVGGDTVLLNLTEPINGELVNVYGVQLYSRTRAIANLVSRITATPVPKAGPGMLQISVRDEVARRAKNIIDVLISEYDKANLEYKNKVLKTEIGFLEERLATIGNELLQQENIVRDFKVSNKVTNVSESANQLLGSLADIDAKRKENDQKKYLADLVENTIKNFSGQEQVISNASGLQDAVLVSLVGKYNDLVLRKEKILDQGTALDPRLSGINRELSDLRSNILNSVNNIRSEIKVTNEFLGMQERATTGRFQTMPEKEKDYVQVNRVLGIKQSMYIFLLQRKEDKNLQLVSSQIGESRIVDSRINKDVLYPKPLMFYGAALGLGLFLPALIILVSMLMNKKIQTKKDIENATTVPIVGEIEMEPKTAKEIIVSAGYRTNISEQFRTLRTNLMYIGQGSSGSVLMVTSSIAGEGKSFVSLNTAHTLALTGKKVVLVEFDLRKPQFAHRLNIKKSPGVTDYAITSDLHPEDIIQSHEKYENLSFICCGPIPPNPAELILNKRIDDLFRYLKENYDYVILDTPPVGIVSDAIIIGKWADLTLFIIRHRYSFRSSLQLLNNLYSNKKLPHISLVINSIIRNKGFQKEIPNSYGYYQEDPKKDKFDILRNVKKSSTIRE